MTQKRLYLPIVVLAIAALACGGGGPSGGPTNTPGPAVIFRDDFESSNSGWSTGSDDTAEVSYADGAYVIQVFDTNWHIWGNPGEDISDARISVTVRNVGEAQDPTFGVLCNHEVFNEGEDDEYSSFYYLGFGPDGYYAIVYWDGEEDIFLTSEDSLWQLSEDIALYADEYQLEAECAADGNLRLIVDGVEIASAVDDTATAGDIGLFALSFEETPVEVHFDDLVVTELE